MPVHNLFKAKVAQGDIDLDTASMVCLLLKSGGTPTLDPDHAYVTAVLGDVSNAELTNAGYARVALSSISVAQDDVNDRVGISAAKTSFSGMSAGETAVAACVFVYTSASDAANVVAATYDITDTATSVGTLEIRWSGTDPGDFLRLT